MSRAADGTWTCRCGAAQPATGVGCNSCGAIPEGAVGFGRCPKCKGALTRPNQRTHDCGWGATQGFGPSEPSQPRADASPAKAREFVAEAAVFDRAVVAHRDATVAVEQSWRNLKLAAEHVAVVEAAVTARAVASCRDQRLQSERQRMHELLRRLESAL